MMCRVVLIVFVSVSAIEAQFRFPLLSQFIPSRSPLIANGRLLFAPPSASSPPSSLRSALSPHQSPNLDNLLGMTAPPPPQELFNASPQFSDSFLRAIQVSGGDGEPAPPAFRGTSLQKVDFQGRELVTEESTSTPFVATPTTIRFTLDDVPHFLELPTQTDTAISSPSSEESISILDDDDDDDDKEANVLPSVRSADAKTHLFILTSKEDARHSSTWRPSTPFSTNEAFGKDQSSSSSTFSSVLQESDTSFRPSFVLPFLDHSSEAQQNLFTVVETRNPKLSSSLLRSEAPHFLDSSPEVFALSPIRVAPEKVIEEQVVLLEPQGHLSLSQTQVPSLNKTPVPKPIIFSEEEAEESLETVTRANKPLPTRKTFHFEQEFLSLLKKNPPLEKNRPEKNEPLFEPNPFWFSEQHTNNEGIWRLKGGDRSPSFDLVSEDTVISQIALKNSLGGVFGTSIRGLSPITHKNEVSLKILDDQEDTASSEGITIKSLAQGGLSRDIVNKGSTTVKPLILNHNFSETRLKLENTSERSTPAGSTPHGPQIVPVGEVGEVTHDGAGSATVSPVPSLSATLKHGVQSLNVTAWVSGCPKLYGNVELKCVVEHDAISNTAMTLMWKKKSFTEGRPREHIMTENDLLKMKDERFSLSQSEGQYILSIKDFRPKDCGTYECEAKAADTTAASQLLLFTCL